jgi:hypothetical protein
MWGNTVGWVISAIWAAIVVTAIVYLNRSLTEISPPGALSRNPSYLQELSFSVSPTTVLPSMTRPIDAGPLYRQAIELARADLGSYEAFVQSSRLEGADRLKAIQYILDARESAEMNLFASRAELLLSHEARKRDLEAISLAGRATVFAGLLKQKSDPDAALVHFESAFSLGVKMFDERVNYAQFQEGLRLISEATAAMRMVLDRRGDTERVLAIDTFDAARVQLMHERVLPVWQAIGTIDNRLIGAHAGDWFYFAANAKERMWRVEATIALGRLRFNVGTGKPGNAPGAVRILELMCNTETDPIVKRAAEISRDMTIEQYRVLAR